MKRKDDVLVQNIGGQDLLVPIGAKVAEMNGMVVLNPAARLIWDLLAEDRSEEDLVTAVVNQFDVDRERAQVDVKGFLSELAGWRLLA